MKPGGDDGGSAMVHMPNPNLFLGLINLHGATWACATHINCTDGLNCPIEAAGAYLRARRPHQVRCIAMQAFGYHCAVILLFHTLQDKVLWNMPLIVFHQPPWFLSASKATPFTDVNLLAVASRSPTALRHIDGLFQPTAFAILAQLSAGSVISNAEREAPLIVWLIRRLPAQHRMAADAMNGESSCSWMPLERRCSDRKCASCISTRGLRRSSSWMNRTSLDSDQLSQWLAKPARNSPPCPSEA